ncbi:MAG: hypothetical protein ABJV04_01385 [Aliiglaciecola sp.]|uniref:hypothetical protein n=1 Tax=Aliiglaciecola sp. TaxID=1872441 RepID=UPI003298274B
MGYNRASYVCFREYEIQDGFGFRLRACRKTYGKIERFNVYLKQSFITPLVATMKLTGLEADVDIANGQIGQFILDVAHQRI